ncbi:uncharacterized protein LOC112453728 [Temnothorax curvispinosus]|uniref:Uncharacterized protein LOC112453728 n=1 Tax=Temnothorax curvispinosus TaxID=300111 RepID=A0A6J1PM30_9HYME|nr:uncharacterized protein LOC112453728 [Temnothorax curvispinosus]
MRRKTYFPCCNVSSHVKKLIRPFRKKRQHLKIRKLRVSKIPELRAQYQHNLTLTMKANTQHLVKKRSRSKSNYEPNKRLASFNGLAHLKELDLETYLRTYDLKSEAAVDNYKLKGTLNERDRSSITNAVVQEMLKVNYVPSQFEYAEIVKKICVLFPSEDPAIYYIPPDTTHRNAQGKLPNKVKNIKYNLQKKDAGTFHFPSSSMQCVSEALERTKITKPAKLEGSINKEDPAIKTAITCLRHESRDSWPQLLAN